MIYIEFQCPKSLETCLEVNAKTTATKYIKLNTKVANLIDQDVNG